MNRRTFLKKTSKIMMGSFLFRKFLLKEATAQISPQISQKGPVVLRVYHENATNWDFQGSTVTGGHYWEHIDVGACRIMINEGLMFFSGKSTVDEAWSWIFNQNGGKGYIKGQKIAIKLNWNDCDPGLGDGPNGNFLVSNMELVQALIESLLNYVSGLRPSDLLVGDPSRTPYDRIRLALSRSKVHIIEFKPDIFTPSTTALVDYPAWQDDYICESMFGQSTHLIDMPLLKAISPSLGISGALKDAQGKIGLANVSYSGNRKAWIKKHNNTFSYTNSLNNLVHMNAHPWIKKKRRLIIGDGLYGLYNGQHFPSGHRDDIPRPWILFKNSSPNNIFFSTDPVAIDCVLHDMVRFERLQQGLAGSFIRPVKFMKPIQLACADAGLGINDDPKESDVVPSPIGPLFSYPTIDYKVLNVTSGKPTLVRAN